MKELGTPSPEGVEEDGDEGVEELLLARRYRQASEWPCVRFN